MDNKIAVYHFVLLQLSASRLRRERVAVYAAPLQLERDGMVDIPDLKYLSLCGKTHTEQGVATKRLFSGPI